MSKYGLQVHVINAGRVDSILIGCDGDWAFIDSGTYSNGVAAVNYIKEKGINKLKYYIGTHGHANHVGGAGPIIKNFSPERIYVSHKEVIQAMLNKASNSTQKDAINKTPFTVLKPGDNFHLGGAKFYCLGPLSLVNCKIGATKENYNSLILRMEYGSKSFLFTGDTSGSILGKIAKRFGDSEIKCDVLKNPHHNGALGLSLLKRINPKYVVICHNALPSKLYQNRIKSAGATMCAVCSSAGKTTVFYSNGEELIVIDHGGKLEDDGKPILSRTIELKSPPMMGAEVKYIQERLNVKGFKCTIDGTFGKNTETSVIQFQRASSIKADGKVGQVTWAALWKNNETIIQTPPIEPDDYIPKGNIVDISVYQGDIDWEVTAQNVDFVIMRGSIGDTKDKKVERNAQGCIKYNIPFGIYTYMTAKTLEKARSDAKLFWQYCSKYNPLYWVVDLEKDVVIDKEAKVQTRAVVEEYMKTLRECGAKVTGAYIANHLYTRFNINKDDFDFIWIPHYGQNTGSWDGKTKPSHKCDLHQFTSVGKVPGIVTKAGKMRKVDKNRITGTGKTLAWFRNPTK